MSKLFEKVHKQGYAVIAEIGVNYYDIARQRHITDMEAAKLMCLEAYKAGADAVKFQTYKAGKLASRYSPSYWDTSEETTTSQYELFRKFDSFGEPEYRELAEYCAGTGVIFMSTPFDFEAADYLDSMMDTYKISSSDLTNLPFIEYMCKKNKAVILSTGAADGKEIDAAISLIESYGNELAVLHCVLEYPTPPEHANLSRIVSLREKYPDLVVGYSDHTRPTSDCRILNTAFACGARILEKHFTLDKSLPGNDHYHAMDPQDLMRIKENLESVKLVLGKGGLDPMESEAPARENARRSVVLTRNLKAGDRIERSVITFKRPGTGIAPADYKKVIGRVAVKDLGEDRILQWEDLDER